MKLTKEQRHEVYKQALYLFLTSPLLGYGLCGFLSSSLDEFDFSTDEGKIIAELDPYDYPEEYPEIHKHKPMALFTGGYWWDKSDRESRIEVLKQAIKETE